VSASWDSNHQRPGVGWDRRKGQRNQETLLGWTKRGREVMYWVDYGVVCPDEATTNGSAYALIYYGAAPVRLTPPGVAFFVGFAFSTLKRRYGDSTATKEAS